MGGRDYKLGGDIMRKKYLTLEERWAMDVEAAKDDGTMISSTPQCKMCKYWIKGIPMNIRE